MKLRYSGVWVAAAVLLAVTGCASIRNYFFPIPDYEQKTSLTNLKMIGLALSLYSEHYRQLPVRSGADGLTVLSRIYISNPGNFVAPFDQQREEGELAVPFVERRISYALLAGSALDAAKITRPSSFPVAMEKPWIRSDGRIGVLYLDGHVGLLKGDFANCAEVVEFLRREHAGEYGWEVILESARTIDATRP